MNAHIKVLLFDDDMMTLRIISTVLSRKGYTVFTSQTAVNVFTTVAQYTPDVILMDYDMPVVSGVEAITQLKSHELYKSIPVIFFSLHASAAEKGIQAGAAMYVSKASSADHLSACIESLVKVRSGSDG